MDEYLSEKEQIQALRDWWKDNGSWVIAGVVIGVGVLVGWNQWQSFVTRRAESASVLYMEIQQLGAESQLSVTQRSRAETVVSELKLEYAATPYDEQAALMMARILVDSGELDLAANELDYVVRESSDAQLALVARLRLAKVRLQQEQYEQALAALAVESPGAFAARFSEMRGDIAYERGDLELARNEYQAALEGDAGLINRNLVQMKLNDLALPPEPDEVSGNTEAESES